MKEKKKTSKTTKPPKTKPNQNPSNLHCLAEHAQDNSGLLNLPSETELARPEPLALSGPLLSILVVLDASVGQGIPFAFAWVHGRGHVMNVLEMAAEVAVLVLAWLECAAADWAQQKLRGRRRSGCGCGG